MKFLFKTFFTFILLIECTRSVYSNEEKAPTVQSYGQCKVDNSYCKMIKNLRKEFLSLSQADDVGKSLALGNFKASRKIYRMKIKLRKMSARKRYKFTSSYQELLKEVEPLYLQILERKDLINHRKLISTQLNSLVMEMNKAQSSRRKISHKKNKVKKTDITEIEKKEPNSEMVFTEEKEIIRAEIIEMIEEYEKQEKFIRDISQFTQEQVYPLIQRHYPILFGIVKEIKKLIANHYVEGNLILNPMVIQSDHYLLKQKLKALKYMIGEISKHLHESFGLLDNRGSIEVENDKLIVY